MSALKKNPFLVGFGAVMVLGVGALGYLAYSAADENAAALSKYKEAEQELDALQRANPSPTAEVVKQLNDQRIAIAAKRDALRKELAAIKIKEQPISGSGFQDRLKVAVAELGAKAPEAGLNLPGGKEKNPYYLGFNAYQGQPPREAAASHLFRQLRALQLITNLMLEVKNITLDDIVRPELKEEKDGKAVVGADAKDKGKTKVDDSNSVIQRSEVTVKFTTTQENLQKVLNGIVANPQQIFVIRRLTVLNDKPVAPPKGFASVPSAIPVTPEATPTPAAPAPATPTPATPAPDASAPATPPAAPGVTPAAAAPTTPAAPVAVDPAAPANPAEPAKSLEYVFGKESVHATLEIEIVDVADPEVPSEKPTAQKKEK